MRWPTPLMAVLAAAALTIAPQAYAGGIGTTVTTGFHSKRVFFYDSSEEFKQYKIGLPYIEHVTGHILPFGGILGTALLIGVAVWLYNTALDRQKV